MKIKLHETSNYTLGVAKECLETISYMKGYLEDAEKCLNGIVDGSNDTPLDELSDELEDMSMCIRAFKHGSIERLCGGLQDIARIATTDGEL